MFTVFARYRSASYRASTGECRLSDMDRHTVAGTGAFKESVGEEYLENNCVDDPVKLCDFQLLENWKISKISKYSQLFRPLSMKQYMDTRASILKTPGRQNCD